MERRDPNLDEVLNAALAGYGSAEPRPGLEGRILANLRALERAPRPSKLWWPALAVCTAVLLISATVLVTRLNRAIEIPVAHVPPNSLKIEHTRETANRPGPRVAPNSKRIQALAVQTPDPGSRPDQFPSPEPLSEQEELLARYVEQFHREAVLMAQAQTELFQQEAIDREAPRDPITQEQNQQEQNP